jgi:hypothetical protein
MIVNIISILDIIAITTLQSIQYGCQEQVVKMIEVNLDGKMSQIFNFLRADFMTI